MVLTGKRDFVVLTRRYDFIVSEGKHDFVDLQENMILRFLR